MSWITMNNVQRTIIPKACTSELQVLCFAHHIMMIYICIKFQENISEQFSSYRVNTNILQKSLFLKFKGP